MVVQYVVGQISGAMGLFYRTFGVKTVGFGTIFYIGSRVF